MEKEKPEFNHYGIENWQNLRDLINTSDKARGKFCQLLTEGEGRFCFVQDYKNRLYLILESQREEFLGNVRTFNIMKDPDWIAKEKGGYLDDIWFEGEQAAEEFDKYFTQKWKAFRVTKDVFSYTFQSPRTYIEKEYTYPKKGCIDITKSGNIKVVTHLSELNGVNLE